MGGLAVQQGHVHVGPWPGERAGSDGRGGGRQLAGGHLAGVVEDLEVGALLGLEGTVVWVAGFEQEVEPEGDGAAGERNHDHDHRRLHPPPAYLRPGLGEYGPHRCSSGIRTVTRLSGTELAPRSRVSSSTRPSISVTTRPAWRVASLASWVTSSTV